MLEAELPKVGYQTGTAPHYYLQSILSIHRSMLHIVLTDSNRYACGLL
jgi:hypothetical protein